MTSKTIFQTLAEQQTIQSINTKQLIPSMKKLYPKHLLLIGEDLIQLGNNFILAEDLSVIQKTLSFTLPDLKNSITNNLKQYQSIKLYWGVFDDESEAEKATAYDLTCIFDGYIQAISSNENKQTGLKYNINCNSTIALLYEYPTETETYNANFDDIIEHANQTYDITVLYNKKQNRIPKDLVIDIETSNNIGTTFDSIKKKYAIQIFQGRNNDLYVQYPEYFYDNQSDSYDYDMEQTIFSINYGEQTNNIDTVVVFGNKDIGVAFDPISYQLKNVENVDPKNLASTITPDINKLNILKVYRKDIYDQPKLNEIARNILIEKTKNYLLELAVPFDPNQQLGETITIKNSSKIDENQKWIIKQRTINISKTKIDCNLKCYSNSIQDLATNKNLTEKLYNVYYLDDIEKEDIKTIK